MADIAPFVLNKPSITIGTAPGTEFQCFAHKVEFAPDQDSNDNDTFCGSYRSYGQLRWTITLSMFQSFGAEGLWKALVPLQGMVVPISITPDDTDPTGNPAGTEDNPTVTANVRVPPLPFLNAEVGEASDFDLDFDVQGTLSYTPDPGTALQQVGMAGQAAVPETTPL